MLGTIKDDGPLINGTWVCEIGGVVKMYFALMDEEEVEDYAEYLMDVVLPYLRKTIDGDGNVLWNGVAPITWRPATQDEYDEYSHECPIEHLWVGLGLPTVPGWIRIN